MTSETDNTTSEFSPLIRRYLREQPAQACPGFDADTATAYLEQSLTASSCHYFEEHLSGCPPCRGHLIQVAHLSALSLEAELPGVTVQPKGSFAPLRGQIGKWISRWQDLLITPIRVPAVGLALTLTAILAGMVAWQFRPSRQNESESLAADLTSTQKPANSQEQSADTRASVEPSPATEFSASSPRQSTQTTPARTPRSTSTTTASLPRVASTTAVDENTLAKVEVPPASLPSAPNIPTGLGVMTEPRPGLQPPRISSGPLAVNSRPQPVSQPRPTGDSVSFAVPELRGLSGFVSPRSRRSGGTSSAVNSKIIRDKTFILEGRTWVDQEYHQLMRTSGNVTLVRGDEAYQMLVAEDPALADFFKLHPVTVVWRGKVYRVLDR